VCRGRFGSGSARSFDSSSQSARSSVFHCRGATHAPAGISSSSRSQAATAFTRWIVISAPRSPIRLLGAQLQDPPAPELPEIGALDVCPRGVGAPLLHRALELAHDLAPMRGVGRDTSPCLVDRRGEALLYRERRRRRALRVRHAGDQARVLRGGLRLRPVLRISGSIAPRGVRSERADSSSLPVAVLPPAEIERALPRGSSYTVTFHGRKPTESSHCRRAAPSARPPDALRVARDPVALRPVLRAELAGADPLADGLRRDALALRALLDGLELRLGGDRAQPRGELAAQ
jgi:hypothetical protein